MSSEFSRPVTLEAISAAGQDVTVEASAAECAALAARLRLPGVRALSCRFRLRPGPAGTIEADGRLSAEVTQICVISLDEFPAEVREDFALRFVPAGSETDSDDPESVDEIPYGGQTIDLGEAAAEQLALALDPYPRKPGAELPEEASPAAENPFARLAALRRTN